MCKQHSLDTFVISIQFSDTLSLSVVLFWEAEFNNHNLRKKKREWEVMKWKKVFLKEKVSEANWLSLFTEPFSPAGRI